MSIKVEVALEVSERQVMRFTTKWLYPKESEEIIRNKVESWVREKKLSETGNNNQSDGRRTGI